MRDWDTHPGSSLDCLDGGQEEKMLRATKAKTLSLRLCCFQPGQALGDGLGLGTFRHSALLCMNPVKQCKLAQSGTRIQK